VTAYYNENDPQAAEWLRELIRAELIASGIVDERDTRDVEAKDLGGYTQCHFFAGIGGWSYALRLAGWRDDRPVWTGSCPCQPFSCAGKGLAERDERHLWPAFRRLIAERKPPVVFSEQVAGKAGRLWLAGVRADLEVLGYAVGAADLPACGVGAPHRRQRLFWVGYTPLPSRPRQRQQQEHLSGNDATGSKCRGDHKKKVLKLPGVAELISGPIPSGGLVKMTAGVESLHARINLRGTMEAFLRPWAVTKGRYMLNPRFSPWLTGFPAEWASCGARAMQSCRKSRRSLSGRSSKRVERATARRPRMERISGGHQVSFMRTFSIINADVLNGLRSPQTTSVHCC